MHISYIYLVYTHTFVRAHDPLGPYGTLAGTACKGLYIYILCIHIYMSLYLAPNPSLKKRALSLAKRMHGFFRRAQAENLKRPRKAFQFQQRLPRP